MDWDRRLEAVQEEWAACDAEMEQIKAALRDPVARRDPADLEHRLEVVQHRFDELEAALEELEARAEPGADHPA